MAVLQSNALRKLHQVIKRALEHKSSKEAASLILLDSMGLPRDPKKLMMFYGLAYKAKEEAGSLRNNNIEDYIEAIEETHKIFTVNSLTQTPWTTIATEIKKNNILLILDSLANDYYSQNPAVEIETELL